MLKRKSDKSEILVGNVRIVYWLNRKANNSVSRKIKEERF